MYSVYSDEFNNKEVYVKRSLLSLTLMFRIFIVIDERYVNESFPSNNFFQL